MQTDVKQLNLNLEMRLIGLKCCRHGGWSFSFNSLALCEQHRQLQEDNPNAWRRRGTTTSPSIRPARGRIIVSWQSVWSEEALSTERIRLITKCQSWSRRGVSSSCFCQTQHDHLLWMRQESKSSSGEMEAGGSDGSLITLQQQRRRNYFNQRG